MEFKSETESLNLSVVFASSVSKPSFFLRMSRYGFYEIPLKTINVTVKFYNLLSLNWGSSISLEGWQAVKMSG